jgi:hypothetical protein
MAGKIATIISLQKDVNYGDRLIVRGMKQANVRSDIRVQPIDDNHAYLIVGNKKKAQAELDFFSVLNAYKALGGKEFDSTILGAGAPSPEMRGLQNDGVQYVHHDPTPMYLNDPVWCAEHGVAGPSNK